MHAFIGKKWTAWLHKYAEKSEAFVYGCGTPSLLVETLLCVKLDCHERNLQAKARRAVLGWLPVDWVKGGGLLDVDVRTTCEDENQSSARSMHSAGEYVLWEGRPGRPTYSGIPSTNRAGGVVQEEGRPAPVAGPARSSPAAPGGP